MSKIHVRISHFHEELARAVVSDLRSAPSLIKGFHKRPIASLLYRCRLDAFWTKHIKIFCLYVENKLILFIRLFMCELLTAYLPTSLLAESLTFFVHCFMQRSTFDSVALTHRCIRRNTHVHTHVHSFIHIHIHSRTCAYFILRR